MDEHDLLDILIYCRTLISTTEKIKKLDKHFDSCFIDNLLVVRQVYIDKLLFMLNEIEIVKRVVSENDLLELEQNDSINPDIFDNFGIGLAKLLGGNILSQPLKLKENENLSFNIKKKSINGKDNN